VYYFFQGHEQMISKFNCFFYPGDTQDISFVWQADQQLKIPRRFTVTDITYRFPSERTLHILSGHALEEEQPPTIVVEIELRCEDLQFSLKWLPGARNFLVPASLYEASAQEEKRLS